MEKVKTEKEKMLSGENHQPDDKELTEERNKAKNLCDDYNDLHPTEKEKKREILTKLLGKMGNNVEIEKMFMCDYGYNISIGDNFYSSYNLIILDGGKVTFGNNVKIGPSCGFYTPYHPIDVKTRNEGATYCKPITVGNNVYIGGNVKVLPGVTIGDNVIISTGSIVNKDIPSNTSTGEYLAMC